MKNKSALWAKAFIGFGILTIASGLYLSFQGDYVIGISGTLVGILLTYQNLKAAQSSKS